MPVAAFLAEIFPGIAAALLGVGGYGWLRHLKKHAHDKVRD